ncbi:MAG: DUF3052 domain-containing protein [Cyclobacteriaceae bacterium]
MAGYSGSPLLKKLGIKAEMHIHVKNPPGAYWDWLSPLPEGITVADRPAKGKLDFVHLFVTQRKHFEQEYLRGRDWIKQNGMLWISWPKKSSGVETDLDGNIVREYGLRHGLVDVKVCAVDEIWSGLKFMYRLRDRK